MKGALSLLLGLLCTVGMISLRRLPTNPPL